LSYGLYSTDNAAPPAIYAATPANPWSHVTGLALLKLNTWTHVAGTYDGAVLRLFINGVQVRSIPLSGGMPVTVGPLRIGGNAISRFLSPLAASSSRESSTRSAFTTVR
jgi:hypothetical protein